MLSFNCSCLEGYEGEICGEDIDECASSPCQNGASCHDHIAYFSCTCVDGYSGYTCSEVINPCDDSEDDCSDDADCSHSGPGVHNCTCHNGFEGDGIVCDDIDDCADSPCGVVANCTDLGTFTYECVCGSGYTGGGVENGCDVDMNDGD